MLFHSVTSSLVCYYILSYIYSQSIFLLMKYFLNKWRAAIISPYLYYLIPRLLNRLEGVSAKVNLKKKTAVVSMEKEVEDMQLQKAVEQAGYKVIQIR